MAEPYSCRLRNGSGIRNDTAANPRVEVRATRVKEGRCATSVVAMRTLATWCFDRRRTVIGLWVTAFIVFAALWATAAGPFVNNFNLPGTESQRAYDLLKDRFPAQAGDTASVVFAVDQGRVLDHRPQIEAVRSEIAKSSEVLAVGDPLAKGAPVSKDGKITF